MEDLGRLVVLAHADQGVTLPAHRTHVATHCLMVTQTHFLCKVQRLFGIREGWLEQAELKVCAGTIVVRSIESGMGKTVFLDLEMC